MAVPPPDLESSSADGRTLADSHADPAPRPGDAPPQRVGRFAIVRRLGAGGMGVVYLAQDPVLDRRVAIKLLHERRDEGTQGRIRLLREARAMAKLAHPNVITVYEVGTHEGRVFLAMEFVDGPTLKSRLRSRTHGWREILELFAAAGEGLAAAHAVGLVHRDFKPDNVLVGSDGRVRVLDFGLARAPVAAGNELVDGAAGELDEPGVPQALREVPERSGALHVEEAGPLTRSGAVLGTPAFMSPEQHLGGLVDARSDQFSFAVALWEALYGQAPFGGRTVLEIAERTTSGRRPTAPSEADVPRWFEPVLVRAMALDPSERHASMAALLEVLRRLGSETAGAGWRAPAPAAAPLRLLGRYEAQGPLGIGASAQWWRALDRVTGRMVTALRLPPPTDRLQAARERGSFAAIEHPNLARVLDDATDDDDHIVVVGESLEGSVTVIEACASAPLPIQLTILAQVLRGLGALHRRGLAHGALVAEHVRVIAGQVKLIGHGLGPWLDARALVPELIVGARPSPSADVFAFGVLAARVLLDVDIGAGAPPQALIEPWLREGTIAALERLRGPFAPMCRRLLAVDPAARPVDVREVLRELADAGGVALEWDTLHTRESHLRSVPLFGRDAELGALRAALRAAHDGRGAAVVVRGESGAGKSRLLDELRLVARTEGFTCITGHAQSEGGPPYQVWLPTLRWLALRGRAGEGEAGVLLAHVPDVAELIGRPVAPAPALDARDAQARFQRTVEDLLARTGRPLLVLLEDLQWARSESLALLDAVLGLAAALPIVIVASVRSEAGGDRVLADRPAVRELRLARLGRETVERYVRALVGDARVSSELIERVHEESEGNAFFMVELLRAFVQTVGNDGPAPGESLTLPPTWAAGGVARRIDARLQQVAPWARALLESAVISGRALDLELLRALHPGADVDAFVAHGVEIGVFDSGHDGASRWRFSHDKLREATLRSLDEGQRRRRHADIAEVLERLGGAHPPLAALAAHWRAAGDTAREAVWAPRAGEEALAAGAYAEAIELLERALALHAADDRAQRADRARWHRMLGEARYVLGDLTRATDELGRALAVAARPLPTAGVGIAWLLLAEIVRRIAWSVTGPPRVPKDAGDLSAHREAALAAGRIANLATYSGDKLRVIGASLLAVNLAERAGEVQPYALAVMGYSASYVGWHTLAVRYFERARAAATASGDARGFVEATQMECVHLLGQADFAGTRALLRQGYERAQGAAYELGMALSEGFDAQCDFYTGDFGQMHARARRALRGIGVPSPEHEHSFVCQEGLALAMLGEIDQALHVLQERAGRVGARYLLGDIFVQGYVAMAQARAQRAAPALEAAERCLADLRRQGIALPPPCVAVYAGVTEAYVLALREAAVGGAPPEPALVRRAERLRRELDGWARRYPCGRPFAALYAGRLLAVRGAGTRAYERLEDAVMWARRLDMPHVEATAEMELGRLERAAVQGRPGAATARLSRAVALFGRCGDQLLERRLRAELVPLHLGPGASAALPAAIDEPLDAAPRSADSDADPEVTRRQP